jgi:branched-chain amino acid transport system substrate-binding protein
MPFSRRIILGGALALPMMRRARAQPDPLPLGALFPFTGMLSLFGDESYRGLELAADEQNGAGGVYGRPIKLVKGDAVDPNAAVSEVKRLVGTEKVAAVFGTFASALVLAASQITELAGIPYFELDATAEPVTDRGFRFLFRSCSMAGARAALSVDAITAHLAPVWGADRDELKVGLLHEDGLYGSTVAAAQLARCKERGLLVTDSLGYPVATTDLSSAVQRLRGAGATVVLHTGYQNDTVLFFRQMKQAGWFPRMVVGAGGGYSLSDTANTIGTDFNGTLNAGVPPYSLNPASAPRLRDVEAAYERRYGGKPRSGHSLASYVGARVFLDALVRAGDPDKDKVREAVRSTDIARGRTSNGWGARFDDKGQNLLAAPVLAQWQGGVLRAVSPDDMATATLRPKLGA